MSRPVMRCTRCRRRLRNPNTPGWNATFKAGVIVGYLCPGCQTPQGLDLDEFEAPPLHVVGGMRR